MTWVDNKDFKHQRDIQNERNSMQRKNFNDPNDSRRIELARNIAVNMIMNG
jgi:hypothetical protein